MIENLDHLSYSSISAYMTCGKAWKYKYIDKMPTKPAESLLIGSCVHDTVEEIIRCRSLGIEEPEPAEFATQTVTRRFEADKTINCTLDRENVLTEAVRLVSHHNILTGIDLVRAKVDDDGPMIERKVILEVPEVDIPIIGYIDIVLDDGTPADFKTASRSWTQERAESELQPVFYLAAMTQCGIPVNWHFRHIVFVKNKTPKFQMFEHHHEPIEIFRLVSKIQEVWKSINSGVFLPAAPGSWKCSPKTCDFWDDCQNA